MSVKKTLSSPNLSAYIKSNLDDLWYGTFLQGYYYLSSKTKGVFGELFTESYLKEKGFKVSGREGGSSDHDMVVDGIKVEVKFSVAQTDRNKKTGVKKIVKDRFMMNHVGIGKDWDRLLFVGINPNFEESRIVWFDKKDIKKIIKNKDYFSHQQGGEHTENDDYISGSNKLINLINSPYARTLDQW